MDKIQYIVKIKFSECDGCFGSEFTCNDKSEAFERAKMLKSFKELSSIQLVERLYGYTDRAIYEFERE